ncbi:MAG: TrkA family potassium uptake protein [Oscillospiraceae bacterium]|nr:TrkA family potassium uptake protein [Oscillospiraceae bacterium]
MGKKSVLLVGLGRFGRHVAQKLSELGHQVMAVDRSEERVQAALPLVTAARIGNSCDARFLSALGVRDYDVCIVAIAGDFQSSLETTALLRELGARKVVSRAATDAQEKFLLSNGADEVVYPEKQVARWAAIRYSADHVLDYIELSGDYAIFQVEAPGSWQGRTVGELNVRKKYNINILAVCSDGTMETFITPDTLLRPGCVLMVMGRLREVQRCFHI